MLAVVFALSFVVLGVGSGSGGIGDILQGEFSNVFGGGQTSGELDVGDARKAVRERPNDPAAYKRLANALVADDRSDEAIAPLERYVKMRPGDLDGLRQLAIAYDAKAQELNTDIQITRLNAQQLSATNPLLDPSGPLAQALSRNVIAQAVQAQAQEQTTPKISELQEALTQQVATWKKIVAVDREDPQSHQGLAQAAEAAGDYRSAVGAYKDMVRLAVDPADKRRIRARIDQLEAALATNAG